MTAWATPDEELTPVEVCRLPEEFEAVELDEVDVLVEADDAAVVGSLEELDVAAPGMVSALTALKTPTAATAAMPAPSVRRFKSPSAASRARMRWSVCLVLSMDSSLRSTS